MKWNIPGNTNVDLSNYSGHEVNNTMMSKGNVTVTIKDFSHLEEHYECSVEYSGPKSIEASSKFLRNPCKYNFFINASLV